MRLICEQTETRFTKMKNASTTLLGAVLLFSIAITPLWAQNDAAEAETNIATAAKTKDQVATSHTDDAGVRIDDKGVHVGGPDGVDIKVPDWGPRLGPLLPIISVLAVFGCPVAILGLIFYFRHRRNRMLHETLRAMIEKGVPIPPELVSGGGRALAGGSYWTNRGNNDLRYGLILIALGIGLLVLAGRIGLIPLFIGVAMIAAWLIVKRTQNNQTPP
jgi:hypothetical protein